MSHGEEDTGEKIWERNGPPPIRRFRMRSRPPKLSETNLACKEMLRWEERHRLLLQEQSSHTDATRKNGSSPESSPSLLSRNTLIMPKKIRVAVKSRTGPIASGTYHTEHPSNSDTTMKTRTDSRIHVDKINDDSSEETNTSQHSASNSQSYPIHQYYDHNSPPAAHPRPEISENIHMSVLSYLSSSHQDNPIPPPTRDSNEITAIYEFTNTTPPVSQLNSGVTERQSGSRTNQRPRYRARPSKKQPYLKQLPSEHSEPFLIYTPSGNANASMQTTSTLETESPASHGHESGASTQQVTTIKSNNATSHSNNDNIPISLPPTQNNAIALVAAAAPPPTENEDLKVISFVPRNVPIVFDASITPDPLDASNHCRSCNLFLSKITDYRSHLRQVHRMLDLPSIKTYPPDRLPDPDDPNNFCRICKKKLKTNKDYKGHLRRAHFMKMVHERMPQTCFTLMINEADPKNTSCKYCMMKFSDGDHFRRHMKRYHSNGKTKAVRGIMRVDPMIAPDPFDENHYCKSCDMKWNVRENYKHHLIMMHDIETDDSVHEYYYCPII